MNYIFCCSVAILACLLVKTNAQVCNADIVFMIDSSDITASYTNLYQSFNNALLSFVNQNFIGSQIRVGMVYYNINQSRQIQLTGDRQSLSTQIINTSWLGGGVLHSVGLSAASTLFTVGARQSTPRIAVLVTPSPSRGGAVPEPQIAQLKSNTGGSSMTVYALGVPVATNDVRFNAVELNAIATNSYTRVMANNLFQQFNTIATAACSAVVTTANPITSAVCSSCDFDEGVGYKGHSDCRKFIRCKQLPDNTYEVIVNDCPDGLFWQQKTKNCVHFPESDCYRNECDSDVPYRFHSVVCSAYFVCSNKRVTHECCPRDRPRFNPTTKTCEFSQTCQFQCEENLARNTGCQEPNKPFVDNNGRIDTCKYIVMVGTIEYEMPCPAGTRYNTSECRCLFSDSTFCIQDRAVDPCSPDLDLDFSNNQVADRANNYSVSNFGPVIISGNSARFTGLQTQRIAIIRYSNVDFGLPLAIRVRYRDEVNRANMTILSTGGCISKPGVYITAGNGRVTIGIVTEELGYSQPFESSLNTQGANSWKDITLWYDGKTLAGYLRDVATNSERAFPVISVSSTVNRIKMVEGSLQLGYAYNTNNPGFTGQIDMTRVWIGCTQITRPQDF